jgi:hypothetical protein
VVQITKLKSLEFGDRFLMTTNQFLVRFAQLNPAFRKSELESCALLSDCRLKEPLNFVEYNDASPFAVLELNADADAAAALVRSLLYHVANPL